MTEPMIPPAAADAAPLGKNVFENGTGPFGPDPFRKATIAESPVPDPFVPAPPPAAYDIGPRVDDSHGCRTSWHGDDQTTRRSSGGAQLIVGIAAGGVAVWSLAGAPDWTGSVVAWLAAAGAIIAALVFLLVAIRR